VLVLPQRDAVLAAKQAAEIDVLSGGRMNVGVGVGWNRVELEGAGFTFSNRGRRVDEQVDVMRLLWTQELVQFDGKYHTLDDVGINPLPVQRPIPIWFGGAADPMLRRMARVGAGWLMNRMPLDRAQELLNTLKGYLEDEGRSMDKFGLDVRLSVSLHGPDAWAAELQPWRDLGATQIGVNTMGAGYSSLDQHLAILRQFIEQHK
jgi:probable F420-dependent oxidoreductase